MTVVIPSYNYLKYIGQCVESVLSQDYPNIEIIVVDDGSTDSSVEFLKNMNVKITIIQQKNAGVSSARNHGLLAARGEYVAFLDADDYWAPSKISKQVNLLLSSKVDLVYAGINLVTPDGSRVTGVLHPEFRGKCGPLFRKYPSRAIVILGTSSALFRKSLIAQSGLLDSNLSYGADWDFFRRFCDLGTVDFLDEPLTFYRQHPENMSAYSKAFASDNLRCVKKMLLDDKRKVSRIRRYQTLLRTYLLLLKYRVKNR